MRTLRGGRCRPTRSSTGTRSAGGVPPAPHFGAISLFGLFLSLFEGKLGFEFLVDFNLEFCFPSRGVSVNSPVSCWRFSASLSSELHSTSTRSW